MSADGPANYVILFLLSSFCILFSFLALDFIRNCTVVCSYAWDTLVTKYIANDMIDDCDSIIVDTNVRNIKCIANKAFYSRHLGLMFFFFSSMFIRQVVPGLTAEAVYNLSLIRNIVIFIAAQLLRVNTVCSFHKYTQFFLFFINCLLRYI